jgi:molecular chaperone DnaK
LSEELLQKFNSLARHEASQAVSVGWSSLPKRFGGLVREELSHLKDGSFGIFKRIPMVLYGILFAQPSYLALIFRSICEDRYLVVNKTLHDLLVKDGEGAIANDDVNGLRKVLGRMMANRFEIGTNKAITALAELVRA